MPPIEKNKQTIVKIVFVLLGVFFSVMPLAQQNDSVPVNVTEAKELEVFAKSWLPGTVMGRFDSRIAAEVEGRLMQLLDVGDRVKKGDKLASIEAFTLSLHVAEMEAEILPKEARMDFLQREVKRLTMLAEQNNAAKNRLDEVSSQFKQTKGELKVARARLAQSRDQLARTSLYAPFDGVVTERYKSEGERVDRGDQIIRLVNTDDLEIQVRVPQEAINNIHSEEKFGVKDQQLFGSASLRTYVPVGDQLSRLYELRLTFQQPEWMSGHAVRVSVPMSRPRKVVVVPRDALVIRQKNVSVFRIDENNIAEFVAVKTGLSEGDFIEVIGDLKAGERVVVRGNERLRPGQKVTIQSNSVQP
ncbi:MAG: efflux RND transporter periplasmic adaptor subunit [Gammaproteobacteria bacterium]|nr:efflux RND transporter periplasmic adaptor subunit [Gammaproteobacteria bacterium]